MVSVGVNEVCYGEEANCLECDKLGNKYMSATGEALTEADVKVPHAKPFKVLHVKSRAGEMKRKRYNFCVPACVPVCACAQFLLWSMCLFLLWFKCVSAIVGTGGKSE